MSEGTDPVVPTDLATSDPERDVEMLAPEGEATATPRKRRRRGGRGRGGSRSAATSASAEGAEGAQPPPAAAEPAVLSEEASTLEEAPDGPASGTGKRKRRRRGGRGRGGKGRTAAGAEPTQRTDGGVEAVEIPGEAALEAEVPGEAPPAVGEGDEAIVPATRKRRRRGGRGRGGRGRTTAGGAHEGATIEPGEQEEPVEEPPAEGVSKPRASRTRPRTKAAREAAPEAVTAQEESAPKPARRTRRKAAVPEPAALPATAAAPAPTRLRRGRQAAPGRRRREPLLVVPRVTHKLMVITEHGERDQIAVLEGRDLVQHYVTRVGATSMVGNVYLGRVQNVLPGMEAAFVDVGRGRNAVLYAGEVNYSPEDLEGGTPPRIEQVLKSGQSVLVQVTKDPIGGKGARLTAQISVPGRYLVLVPDSNITGISRRLPDPERRRLKTTMRKIRPEGHGLIVRTAAEGADADALAADVERLLDEWTAIEKKAKRAKAPTVLYEEPELTVRAVRDLFNDEEFRELVTDSPRVYQVVTQYLAAIAPELLPKVRLHRGKLPVFEEFHIVEQIHKGLDRKVWLPSGGYLVIDRTEALTVIDVNTGKSVGRSNLEETVVNTNLEAAREVARQLRLRDIGGMIIIDFIDMLLEQNKKKVVETMEEALAQDKTRSQVFDISPLGLLEVTRKRVSGGLLESFSETCPTCEGRGVLLTYDVS